MPRVHPRAEVDPGAKLAQSAAVGAFAVVGPEVELADDVWIGPHAYLTGRTTVGPGTSIFSFAVVGEDPQDKSFTGETSELLIGVGNVIREHCSIHTGTRKGGRRQYPQRWFPRPVTGGHWPAPSQRRHRWLPGWGRLSMRDRDRLGHSRL